MRLYVLVALAVAASTSIAQQPSRFQAEVGTFGGHVYNVELRSATLVYEDSVGFTKSTVVLTPSRQQWRAFRRALDEIGVWSWRERYEPDGVIFDGTGWSLSLRYPDRSLVTEGGNCYPDAHGERSSTTEVTATFRQFEAAVEALLGGRRFRADDEVDHR
jgi:hypothetical protein